MHARARSPFLILFIFLVLLFLVLPRFLPIGAPVIVGGFPAAPATPTTAATVVFSRAIRTIIPP